MAPSGDRPARQRLTEEELRAAFAHRSPSLDPVQLVTGRSSIDLLLAYRREAQAPRDSPARAILLRAGPPVRHGAAADRRRGDRARRRGYGRAGRAPVRVGR